MTSSIKENIEILLNEQSKYGDIKASIDNLCVSFTQITNLTCKLVKAEHGTILPDGEALSPQTAAGPAFLITYEQLNF